MKKKKWKTPAICLAVLALLLVLYGLLRVINTENEETEETGEKIVNIDSETVTEFTVRVEGQDAVFVKSEDSWKKSDDDEFPVNEDELDSLVSTFSELTADRTITDVTDPEEYGLGETDSVVTLKQEDGDETVIHIGSENKDTEKYYVNLNGVTDTTYVVDVDFSGVLPEKLLDLASGESFPTIGSSNITSVEVNSDTGYYRLQEDDTSNWTVDDGSGTEYSAEYQTVSSLNTSLAGFSFIGLADYSVEDFSAYGLDTPAAAISVKYEETVEEDETESSDSSEETSDSEDSDSEEEQETVSKEVLIYIGNQDEDGNYYVRIGDSDQVQLVLEDTVNGILDMTAQDFWDSSLGYTSVSSIERMEITYAGETTEIVREEEEITDEDGNTETEVSYISGEDELDADLVESFLNSFNSMEAQSKDMSLSTEESPEMILKLYTEEGEKRITLTPYNENFYLGIDAEGRPGSINKNSAASLFEKYENIFAESE